MLTALALVAALGAAPVTSLAAPGFQSANVDPKIVDSFLVHFAQQLASRGFRVTTPQEVAAVLGLERQKALLNCSDQSCNMEIASALGVDALITGSIGRMSSGYLANVKIIRATDASALAVFSARPKTDDEVADFLEASAEAFARQYPPKEKGPALVAGAAPAPRSRALPLALAGGAAVSLVAGGLMLAASQGTASDLRAGKAADFPALQTLEQRGRVQENVGWGLCGLGAALAVASAGAFVLGAPAAPVATVLPLPGGAVLSIGGAL